MKKNKSVIVTFRITRKPSFANSVALLKDFEYRPEAREGYNAQYCRYEKCLYIDRQGNEDEPGNEEAPPALNAPIILGFDDDRMEKTYDKKSDKA